MWIPGSPAVVVAVLAVPIVLILVGLYTAARSVRHGGLHAALVRVLLDPAQSRRLVVSMAGLALAFVTFGLSEALQSAAPAFTTTFDYAQFFAFVTGSVSLLAMIFAGPAMGPLGLDEQLDLRDAEPTALAAIAVTAEPLCEDPDIAMYIAQDRFERGSPLPAAPGPTALHAALPPGLRLDG